ncbi:MAG: UDP-N-acetylmuramoyl-L-alanyl-D-glutamate--2,6-diaminopimelate ligase [Candidatus Levybacteria bacterium]|nr:UDP-N-acetylmuramoyl-L-alanyl-D-glutamate--2,6-diaminopimelate ligase [Candidatus Levybacteria bacterium]
MWQKTKNIYHLLNATWANIYYLFPSRKLTVIGVTGTDGKTTTASLIYHILKTAGKNVSAISSIEALINGKTYDTGFHVTTPSSWKLQRLLKQISNPDGPLNRTGKKYVVLEVTSHALDQHRIWGINFEAAVLTNVTDEHLDYHKTYKNYVLTKLKLLKKAKIAVTNYDDDSFKIISKDKVSAQLITYGNSQEANVSMRDFSFDKIFFGQFNNYNVLAAAAICKSLGIPKETIVKAVNSFELPKGRQEIVHDDDFIVMIDFAHTPNAFVKLLQSARKETKGRIIHVFGSAGKRDTAKRPLMGKASDKFSDVIILTSEDPRGESVGEIMDDIEKGIKNKSVIRIADRQDAIGRAIKMAKKDDLVVLTGKSHEKSMNFGNGEEFWDEYEAVEKALKKL